MSLLVLQDFSILITSSEQVKIVMMNPICLSMWSDIYAYVTPSISVHSLDRCITESQILDKKSFVVSLKLQFLFATSSWYECRYSCWLSQSFLLQPTYSIMFFMAKPSEPLQEICLRTSTLASPVRSWSCSYLQSVCVTHELAENC